MINKISILNRFADVTKQFADMVSSFIKETVYKTPPFKKNGKKFLTVKRRGTEKDGWFYYVERLGKNSVAFLLFDKSKPNKVRLLQSYSSPYEKFITDAYTGSLDKSELTIVDTLIEEVREEAGYTVDASKVIPLNQYPVGPSYFQCR